MIFITLPIRLVSEANAHEHWRIRQRRAKAQRAAVMLKLCTAGQRHDRGALANSETTTAKVTITRIAPRALDSDNLQGSAKAVRDSVAEYLGIDDRTTRIEWVYGQEKGPPKAYAVRIVVELYQPVTVGKIETFDTTTGEWVDVTKKRARRAEGR